MKSFLASEKVDVRLTTNSWSSHMFKDYVAVKLHWMDENCEMNVANL